VIWLTDAKYLSDYAVYVRFNNGHEANLDLRAYIFSKPNGTVFEALKELSNFQTLRFNQDTDTIEWENGADVAPERLYELSQKISLN
jgi:hypothetical protein